MINGFKKIIRYLHYPPNLRSTSHNLTDTRKINIFLPVDDIVEPAGLGCGQVLAVIVALARGLWVEVLRVAGVEVGLQAEALRGAEPGIPQPHLVLLRALIQHDELVLLPVASFGVRRALRYLHSCGLREAGVLAAAGLRWGVGLAV